MLSERQRNITVELTLAGQTAQYIADRFDCSISTIRRIRNKYRETGRWQRLPGNGHPRQGRPQPLTSAISWALSQKAFKTHAISLTGPSNTGVCYTLWASSFQTNCPEKAPWSDNLQSCCRTKTDISLENRLRRRRWCTRTLNWTVPDNWSCILFSDESRFNLAYCDARVRLCRAAGEEYIRMANRNRIDSRGGIRKHFWRHTSSIRVSTWQCPGPHGASN